MDKQVFTRISERFAGLASGIDLENCDDFQIVDTMSRAGETFYCVLEKNQNIFGDTPAWMTKKPCIELIGTNRKNEAVEYETEAWDTYWWHVVVWLTKEKYDSGITLPTFVKTVEPGSLWGDFSGQVLSRLVHPKTLGKRWKVIWNSIAISSVETCRHLDFILNSNGDSSHIQATDMKMRFDLKGLRIIDTDGKEHGMTKGQAKVFGALLKANGGWVEATKTGLSRPDKAFKNKQSFLNLLIERNDAKGWRLAKIP